MPRHKRKPSTSTVENMANDYLIILDTIILNPDIRLKDIELESYCANLLNDVLSEKDIILVYLLPKIIITKVVTAARSFFITICVATAASEWRLV